MLKFQTTVDVESFLFGTPIPRKARLGPHLDAARLDAHLHPRHIDQALLRALVHCGDLQESDMIEKY